MSKEGSTLSEVASVVASVIPSGNDAGLAAADALGGYIASTTAIAQPHLDRAANQVSKFTGVVEEAAKNGNELMTSLLGEKTYEYLKHVVILIYNEGKKHEKFGPVIEWAEQTWEGLKTDPIKTVCDNFRKLGESASAAGNKIGEIVGKVCKAVASFLEKPGKAMGDLVQNSVSTLVDFCKGKIQGQSRG